VWQTDIDIPTDAKSIVLQHRVAFHETDAMGVVHHSNYLKFMEEARVAWMDEHERPYTEYIKAGRHFTVTRVESEYRQSSHFHEMLQIKTAMRWARGASVLFIYEIKRDDDLIVCAQTEHVMIDDQGRPRRIPKEWLASLKQITIE